MIRSGSIPLNGEESAALARLAERVEGQASYCRTEPGEKGPIRVEIGGDSWLIQEDGTTRKER